MRRRTVFLLPCLALLAACAGGPAIDGSYSSRAQDSRVRYVILHYTHGDSASALRELTEGEVSSHYLITDQPVTIYQLVDENRRAWHAGHSAWQRDTQLNASSIGIELVNPGYDETPSGRVFHPYAPAQIEQLISLLRQIVKRHNVAPDHILGHNEIAPQRKLDPGPMFPWHLLAQAGLIPWPDAAQVQLQRQAFEQQLPDILWFQTRLAQHGFALAASGIADEPTRNCLSAFQMKYRPARFDGEPDAETAAILAVLDPVPAP